jgi:hypothetical protein
MRKLAAATVAILAIAVLAYPLSIGPACVVCNRTESGELDEVFCVIYGPLGQLPAPLRSALEQWQIRCELIWQSLTDE